MSQSVSANSKYFSVLPLNGNEFNPSNKIIFEVQPDIGFVKGKDCYLVIDVSNQTPGGHIMNWDVRAGANGLIQRMDIYSLNNGTLLESLSNYNQWKSIENQYLYSDKTQLVNKEGVSDKCFAYENAENIATGAVTRNKFPNFASNINNSMLSPITTAGIPKFMRRRYCLPLMSGVFQHWEVSEKLVPIMLMGGLRIEITLADADRCIKRSFANLVTAGTVNPTVNGYALTNGAVAGGAVVTDDTALDINSFALSTAMSVQLGGGTITLADGSNPATVDATISTISYDDSTKKMTLVLVKAGSPLATLAGGVVMKVASAPVPNYKVHNAELRLAQIIPSNPKALIKDSNYEFMSYDLFLDNLPLSSLSHQTEITSIASRGKALFSMMVDTASENDAFIDSYYCGESPAEAKLNSIQYFINNKLYPLKAYNPNRGQDKIQNQNEVVKAWRAINKNCVNLGSAISGNLADYSNTYLIARELSRGQYVYNLKDSEAQLRTRYSTTRSNNFKINTYCFSKKIVNVSNEGLVVIN